MQGVKAAVDADAHMVVAAVLAVASYLAHYFSQFVVVRENRPAISIAAKGFAGEETGAGDCAEIAAFSGFVSGAKALCGVFNDGDAVLGRDGIDGIKVGALAVQAHGHNGFGSRGYGSLQQGRIQVVGAGIDVHINRLSPEQSHGFGGGDVGKAGSDDFVARAYTQSHLGDLQSIRAVGHGDAVFGAGVSGQLFFQLSHFRAQDVLAVVENFLYVCVDFGLEALVLGFEIEEFHRGGFRLGRSGRTRERVAIQAVVGTGIGACGSTVPL